MSPNHVVLIYPHQGFSGTYVRHQPLSLIYVSAEIVKSGFDVTILDTRVQPDWQDRLRQLIASGDVLCVGISVMSGSPINNAIEIGRTVKALDQTVPVIWGGPHATFSADSILRDEPSADYAVSGYGAEIFDQLCKSIRDGKVPFEIPGITWREGAEIKCNPADGRAFEFIHFEDIPYHLINDYSVYGQIDQDKRIISMYSAHGCPYQCSFCSSPAQYSSIKGKKWVPLGADYVVDHIEHVVDKLGANYIYFIDDDSFPKLKHVEDIIDQLAARKISVGLGFRGARINEIKKMDDAFLNKLAAAGTDIMHIGAESGSDRILNLIRKDCTADEIIAANRKLARHPQITAAYNFMMGVPTETFEELKKTRDLMLQLVDDHSNCIVFPPNKFRPLPGTELYTLAQKEWDYQMPNTLEEWANIEVEADISNQWYEARIQRFSNLMLICSYFVDDKITKMSEGRTLFLKIIRVLSKLYKPFAMLRLKHGWSRVLIEYELYRLMTRIMVYMQTRSKNSDAVLAGTQSNVRQQMPLKSS